MKGLKELGWSLVGLLINPLAKFAGNAAVSLANKTSRKEDNDWLVSFCERVVKLREEGKV